MVSTDSLQQNQLLAALSEAEARRLSEQLEPVSLECGEVLYRPGETCRYAYFPTSCIVSMQNVMACGVSAETAGVGNEGVVGISLLLGGSPTPSTAVVQAAGGAYRLEGRLLRQEFSRGDSMHGLTLRYAQTLIAQLGQTGACNRHHSVKQQFCRWLLLAIDRLGSDEVLMTHELLAATLGVRRESVSLVARSLQSAGCIGYFRGRISVLDRAGLESEVCECYEVLRRELAGMQTDIKRWLRVMPADGRRRPDAGRKSAGSAEGARPGIGWAPPLRTNGAGWALRNATPDLRRREGVLY